MRADIQTQIDITKESIKTSMESFIMDPTTNSFNDIFLHEYLINYLRVIDHGNLDRNVVLMVIHIDNISKINVKYSSKIGDETIVNLGYLIKQIQSDDELLFKTKGPGYTLLLHDFKGKSIKEYASKIQTEVKKAEIFFDPITVSIAIVRLRNIDQNLTVEEKAERLLVKAVQRINYSHELTDNAFIDKDNMSSRSFLGKVLIADSDTLAVNISRTYLERNSYQVVSASNGIDAVELAKKQLFDVIIVDRYLLKQDGIVVKQYLNESSINMNTLFILTVQYKDVSIIDKANHLGIDYVITKPIIYEEILGIIERSIRRKGADSQ